jgi:hypothetical protein
MRECGFRIEAMRAFDRWRALSREQKRLSMHACIAVGAAVVALRVVGVERTLRIASRPVKGPRQTVIDDVVTAIDRAGRYVPGSTCLSRSLALAWMLRGSGVAADVRLGVKTAGGFDAHAWVECDGIALEDVPQGYATF